MGYCPENLKFNLTYILHANSQINGYPFAACDNTYPDGTNQSGNFLLNYGGATVVGGTPYDHTWTGHYIVTGGINAGQRLHTLYSLGNGEYGLHIDDQADPLLRSLPDLAGNNGDIQIADVIYNACIASEGNLLQPCTGGTTNTEQWIEINVGTGWLLACRQYISPAITQIGSCTGAPSPQCTASSGHFTIQRNINVCGPTQAGAESDFDSQVPAGAFDIIKTTSSRSIVPEDDFLSSDFLISKSLYDISPLRAELNRLTAKLKHYSDIINCKKDTLDSVQEFHSAIISSANQSSLANARIIPPPKVKSSTFDKFYSARTNAAFFSQIATRDLGVTSASHLFAVDPDNDNLVRHFMIPNALFAGAGPFETKFNPALAGQVGAIEKENFIQSIKAFADKVGAKIEKIRKHFEDDFSFCSELAIQKNQAAEAKYVFEGLTYTIEIEYDEVEYSMNDCATKTVTSTTPRTETLTNQTFSVDEEITVNID